MQKVLTAMRPDDELADARDTALLLIGWKAALRTDDLHRLDIADLVLEDAGDTSSPDRVGDEPGDLKVSPLRPGRGRASRSRCRPWLSPGRVSSSAGDAPPPAPTTAPPSCPPAASYEALRARRPRPHKQRRPGP